MLTEEMSSVRSAAVGVWVRFGSVHEHRAEMGIAHLLEHMVFKGTQRRSARDIALVLERLGGSLDAYTTREHTSYQARVLDEHVETAFDVLADLVLDPVLRPADLELEREVILEEIAAVEDTPDDLIFDLHTEALWGQHPYGHNILGTRDTITRVDSEALRRVHEREYRSAQLIVAAAGNIEHDTVVERTARLFERDGAAAGSEPVEVPAGTSPREVRIARDSAQTHLVFGVPTFGYADPRRYALVLLSTAFGGGMSSRLFQHVREELGLAYTVYSFHSFYRVAGAWGVYLATRPEWADRAAETVREDLRRVSREGLTAEELEDAKGQVKGQIVLALESPGGRLLRLAGFALYDEPFLTLDEMTARVDAVTLEQVAEVAGEYLDPDRQVVLRLGP